MLTVWHHHPQLVPVSPLVVVRAALSAMRTMRSIGIVPLMSFFPHLAETFVPLHESSWLCGRTLNMKPLAASSPHARFLQPLQDAALSHALTPSHRPPRRNLLHGACRLPRPTRVHMGLSSRGDGLGTAFLVGSGIGGVDVGRPLTAVHHPPNPSLQYLTFPTSHCSISPSRG